MNGLFELVGSKKDGAIVRSLDDKVTKFVSTRIHNFSHLESIEVYTVRDNVNLVEVLQAMDASTEPQPADKDAAAVKAYFQKVYPDMDFERVYASDMKKMVKWYNVLKANNVAFEIADEETESDEVEAEETNATEATDTKADLVAEETAEVGNETAEPVTVKKKAPAKSKK